MIDFKQVSTKTKFSEQQFYSVAKIVGDDIELKNEQGESIVVSKGYVENCLVAADQFKTTKKVNKTEGAQIFLSSSGVVLTASFQKQVKEEDVLKEIQNAYQNSIQKDIDNAVKKAVKSALNGVERIIVGRHNGKLDDLGRVHFIDMEIDKDNTKSYDNRVRQVDPRTLNWFIVEDVKYEIK